MGPSLSQSIVIYWSGLFRQIEMNPTPVKAVQEGLDRIFKGLLSLKLGPRRILNVTPDAAHAGKRAAPAQTSIRR